MSLGTNPLCNQNCFLGIEVGIGNMYYNYRDIKRKRNAGNGEGFENIVNPIKEIAKSRLSKDLRKDDEKVFDSIPRCQTFYACDFLRRK